MNSSIVKRLSNIELVRIISILLVMVVHASYKSLGIPTQVELIDNIYSIFFRSLSESFSIICVNVFVIISGWFGIKFKPYRLFELIFQVLFIGIAIYVIMRLAGLTNPMSLKGWIDLFLINDDGYWFIRSYIILYVFAPALNCLVTGCEKRELQNFLLFFFIIQTIYGFVFITGWFARGYSPISFMGLYVLARYIRIYPNRFTSFDKSIDILLYFLFSGVITILSLTLLYYKGVDYWSYQYSSPLVIISSVYFFLFFTKMSFQSTFINWISLSSFAAYLVHCNPNIFTKYYIAVIRNWYTLESCPAFLLKTSLLIISFFIVSIMVDKIRIFIWDVAHIVLKRYRRMNFKW